MGGIITGVNRNIIETKEGVNIEQMQERIVEIDGEEWNIFTIYSKGELNIIEEKLGQKDNINDINLILGGDFNARTAEEGNMIDIQEGTETKRKSKDKTLNREGKRLLHLIEENGLSILNGNTKDDEEGNFTFIDTIGESVIDYDIVNEKARHKIKSFEVLISTETQHQPLKIELNRQKISNEEIERIRFVNWSEEGIIKYKKNLTEKFSSPEDMKDLIAYTQDCLPIEFKRKKNTQPRTWWNKHCEQKRKKLRKVLRKWKRNEVLKEVYLIEKKKYKEICERTRHEFTKDEKKKIENLRNENDIWRYINSERKQKCNVSKNISMEAWYTHFIIQLEGSAEKVINILPSQQRYGRNF